MLSFDKLVLKPCMDTFGEVNQGYPIPIYLPKSAGQFTIDGVFDAAYREDVIRDGQIVTVTMPVFGAREAEFQTYPKQDDYIQIRGKTLQVREVRTDSHGHLKLMLNYREDYESVPDADESTS